MQIYVLDVPKTTFSIHLGHYKIKVMSFGFTNAPVTFHILMNKVSENYLHKFVLLFLDDILVYSSKLERHATHLCMVLYLI